MSEPEATAATAGEAARHLRETAAAKKCWPCGCLHASLAAIDRAGQVPRGLDLVLGEARKRLDPVRYDCLGCDVCYPALAVNALVQAGVAVPDVGACPTEPSQERPGWPPLPGAYAVVRYRAPVAVCTLTNQSLADALAREAGPDVAIIGTLQTENLGIERLVRNVVANPNLRFLILCGSDSRQAIGHLPGQSLLALARSGTDDRGRIVGANGRRPVLRNLDLEAVQHFRRTVKVVDLVGEDRPDDVLAAVRSCAERNLGPVEVSKSASLLTPIAGHLPETLVTDPAGYVVVFVDRSRRLLTLEHYRDEGLLDARIEGRTATEVWTPAIERKLVSRLDHAAYLGRELARAEHALVTGEPYVQDAAPEASASGAPSSCGCGPNHSKVCS